VALTIYHLLTIYLAVETYLWH